MLGSDGYEGPGFQIITFLLPLGLVNSPENSPFPSPFLSVCRSQGLGSQTSPGKKKRKKLSLFLTGQREGNTRPGPLRVSIGKVESC